MAKGKKKHDPDAKRPDETDLQWRSRMARKQETQRKFGEGIVTPETLAQGGLEKIIAPNGANRDTTLKRRTASSLARLESRGVITSEQLWAAQEIALEAERLEAPLRAKTMGMVDRVDCGGSARDPHAESLHRVRMARAYSTWRLRIPLPRRMVIDMVMQDYRLAAIAASYNRSWRKAIVVLKYCLDMWAEEKRAAFDGIDQEDVDAAIAKVA